MKITILDAAPDEEEEIIIRCRQIDDNLRELLQHFRQEKKKLNAYLNGQIFLIEPESVYYFESVDQRVFAYCEQEVYEVKSRLYELEDGLPSKDFLRAGKSVVLNMNQIKSLTPAFGGRFEALLKNGEKVIISRQYVGILKEKLGL